MSRSVRTCTVMKDVATRGVEFRDKITWDEFSDGWPNIFIDSVKDCAGKDGTDSLILIYARE